MEPAVLVTSWEAVVENVLRFRAALDAGSGLVDQLPEFKHWYYVPELKLFGPSKFIGYEGMTSSSYNYGHGGSKSGGRTEATLRQWFVEVPEGSSLRHRLLGRLDSLLSSYAKAPNRTASIHVPRDWSGE